MDPLDGTREFAAGHDEFTVNIGLVRHGAPVLGVVGVPALGELFGGIVGAAPGSAPRPGEQADHRPHPAGGGPDRARLPPLRQRCPAAAPSSRTARSPGSTNYGSALKIARLAEGVADLYPRFGRTMEWDTAGPQAVLEAAGGRCCTAGGEPLSYGKPGWENPHFICCGR